MENSFKDNKLKSIEEYFNPLRIYVKNKLIFNKLYFRLLKKGKVKKHYNKIKEFIHKRRLKKFNDIKRKNNAKKKIILAKRKDYYMI
jgi:hypothetical protein